MYYGTLFGKSNEGGAVRIFTPEAQGTNTGHVQITGVEVEVQAELAPDLLVDASGAWLNYDFEELGAAAGVAGGPAAGDIGPYVPERKASLGIQYTANLGRAGSLTPRLDYTWHFKSYADPDNNPYSKIPAYGLANLHLTWDSEDTLWQARLEVSNLADKFYWASPYSQYNASGMVVGRPGHASHLLRNGEAVVLSSDHSPRTTVVRPWLVANS